MTQTGTGTARAMRVFRRRIDDLWPASAGKVWWQEDTSFVPPPATEPPAAPASVLCPQMGRSFEDPFGVGGGTSVGQGSISFFHGVQQRPGMLEAQETGEAKVRLIGDPSENDDAEDVWTMSGVEINHGVRPTGIQDSIASAFAWTQYVIAYQIAEGFV